MIWRLFNYGFTLFTLLQKCKFCQEDDCLKYIEGDNKILNCSKCGCIYSEIFPQQKQWFPEYKIKFTERILLRIQYFTSNLNSNQHLKYLKSKTDMKFHNVLEIGSGYGTFVLALDKMGINVTGIEYEQKHVNSAVTKKIKCLIFDEKFQSDEKYDLIFFSNMIFYLPNIEGALYCAKKMLEPKGLILIMSLIPESHFVKDSLVNKLEFGVNIPSMKNWIKMTQKLELKLLDYTIYRSNLHLDFRKNKNKAVALLKYLLKIKRPFVESRDGQYCYFLLANN